MWYSQHRFWWLIKKNICLKTLLRAILSNIDITNDLLFIIKITNLSSIVIYYIRQFSIELQGQYSDLSAYLTEGLSMMDWDGWLWNPKLTSIKTKRKSIKKWNNLRGIDIFSREITVKIVFAPFWKGCYLKRKEFAPKVANSFLLK